MKFVWCDKDGNPEKKNHVWVVEYRFKGDSYWRPSQVCRVRRADARKEKAVMDRDYGPAGHIHRIRKYTAPRGYA